MMQAPVELSLASVAPLILPVNAAATAFEGFIAPTPQADRPASLWLRISGVQPGALTLRDARLEVCPELAALLAGQQDALVQRLAESASLAAFFVELQNMVDQLSLARPPPTSCRPATFYSSLSDEVAAIGWRHVAHLSDDLSQLTLAATDMAGRRHQLRLTMPPTFPAEPPSVAADLPAAFALRYAQGATRLADVLEQFECALAQHQQLWDSLDDLDRNAWVIEPTAAPRSAVYRRIALGQHVSLALSLDPAQPTAMPLDCRFMGAAAAVAPLRQRLHDNRGRWQPGHLLRHNLEAVLEVALPQRQGADAEEASADCAICYAYRLAAPDGEGEGDAPDISCDNAPCGIAFHRRCLVEWLNSDTTTRQSFNTLFGSCPYCSAPITVKTVA